MKQGLTVQQLIDAFPEGTINIDTLDKLYVGLSSVEYNGAITDRGWIRLGDLMEQVRTERIVDYVPELVQEAQYGWVPQLVRAAEDTTETVVNTTAVNALMGTGKAAMLAGTAYDVYENLRNTNTKIKTDSSFGLPRESDFRKDETEFVVPKSKYEYQRMKAKKDREEKEKE